MPFDPNAAASFIAAAHAKRDLYENLAGPLAPPTIADAYAAQEALRTLWEPIYGPVGGLKIATTTKIMQQLMGIDHPCGGMIYSNRIHKSPYALRHSDYRHVVVECELAVRAGRTFEKKASPWTREEVRAGIDAVMPAFELIEDRNAVYRETNAVTLIADNAWNAGIVLGAAVPVHAGLDLDGIGGKLEASSSGVKSGKTDDPMGALAFIANLAADRGRPLAKGQVVITGSVIVTLPILPGETFHFTLDGVGRVEMTAQMAAT